MTIPIKYFAPVVFLVSQQVSILDAMADPRPKTQFATANVTVERASIRDGHPSLVITFYNKYSEPMCIPASLETGAGVRSRVTWQGKDVQRSLIADTFSNNITDRTSFYMVGSGRKVPLVVVDQFFDLEATKQYTYQLRGELYLCRSLMKSLDPSAIRLNPVPIEFEILNLKIGK
jgi:hypothetical protein